MSAKKGGTIKGSVNISFKKLNAKAVAKDPDAVMDILIKQFGVS
jgi:3-mercaptopyruvate sulfurtransferase SseA